MDLQGLINLHSLSTKSDYRRHEGILYFSRVTVYHYRQGNTLTLFKICYCVHKFIVSIADYNSFSQQSTEYVAILYCYSLHAASRFWCHIFIIRFCLSLFFSFVFLKYYLIRINFLHATKHFKHLSNKELKETCHRTVNLTYCKISHTIFAVIVLQLH